MIPFDYRPRTRIVFGAGEFARLGEIARDAGGNRCLLVADQATAESRAMQAAVRSLKARRMDVVTFHDFPAAPTPATIEAGCVAATAQINEAAPSVDLIVAMGRGGAIDAAKAINIVMTNGGSIRDYRGYAKVSKQLLPMVAVPTVAGSGSEASSTAFLFDPSTRETFSCGDAKIAFRAVLLDGELTLGQSAETTAVSGYDAIAHAIETLASPRRTPLAECYAREAWRLLDENYARVIRNPEDVTARGAMLLAAHFAGIAAENATHGPAHACAAPITANFGLPHGAAVALVLPAVIEWGAAEDDSGAQAHRLRELREVAALTGSLKDAGIPEQALPRLAEEAAAQWSGRFGSRSFDAGAALAIYQAAY